MPSVLFASIHCYLDFSSGASVSVRDLLLSLCERGWRCQTLCGSGFDSSDMTPALVFNSFGLKPKSRRHESDQSNFSIHSFNDAGIESLVYQSRQPAPSSPTVWGHPYLQVLDRFLAARRPDVILTFGGGWIGRALLAVARRHAVPSVFWLRTTRYEQKDLFEPVAGIIVPCQFTARHYKSSLGLNCDPISSPIRLDRILCENRDPRHLTFVGPRPDKGVFYFIRIAAELARLRPDIPMLVIAGRGNEHWLKQAALNLHGLPNLHHMPATTDPRKFLSTTRAFLAPSLWLETFMRVPAEGLFNGIPSLASRRGGIPETLGDSGFLFDVPPRYTPDSRCPPSADEVRPWVQTIIRLWDDQRFYQEQSNRCLAEARRLMPEIVIPRHEAVLERANRAVSPLPDTRLGLADDLAPLRRFLPDSMPHAEFVAEHAATLDQMILS